MADALDLLAEVEFGLIQVDEFPGEPEYLALAQAQDQDEHERCVKRLTRGAGRYEELARVIDGPPAALARSRRGQPDDSNGVTRNQLVLDRTGVRGPERVASVSATARGQDCMTALTDRTAGWCRGPGPRWLGR
jgi:hypothetical protein